MSKLTDQDLELLRKGVWPGSEELVVGVIDEETGVVSKEIRVQSGERIPAEAWKLLREQFASGGDPIEVPRFDGEKHSAEVVQRAIGKQRH